MANALVPELAVTDWRASKHFYCEILGFECEYERPEEGFCYLRLGDAELMIDQIGIGRTFGLDHGGHSPLGKGVNLQIRVASTAPLLEALRRNAQPLFLVLEEKWYRSGDRESGNRQFVVADPDGYLLRFYENLGSRLIIWET